VTVHYHIFETPRGFCAIAWNDKGVVRFRLPGANAEATEQSLLRRLPDATPAALPPDIAEAVRSAQRYFAGEKTDFSAVPADLGKQTDLFEKIYAAARQLGYGETTTYGAMAKRFGDDWEIAREVGQAMAKNPIPLIVPCHRVLAAGGKVGGFSAPGGSETKLRMLEMEGVHLEPKPEQGSLAL
jgi:methylated-DNA-[protein]-cysteine S-methyltransferase